MLHRRTQSAPLTMLAVVALLGGCGGATGPAPLERANVLLVVVDTLGAEHLGSYGETGVSSPNLDRLAAEGVRFENAFSTAPWTQPSVASLFTSLLPSRHGVENLLDTLSDDAQTLAETLAAAGYSTHAVVSHFLINEDFGFEQGFESFDASSEDGHDGITSLNVTDRAIELLEARDERPFFLFVHYFDPHFRYQHHAEFDRTSDYGGNLEPGMPIRKLREMRTQLTPLDLEYLVGLYREEIAYTDLHIGRLLDRLEELGLSEDTLVVFTADHGEEFMEHGWLGHTIHLYDDLIRVPLIVRYPGAIEPGVVDALVSIIDVAPTVSRLVLGADFSRGAEGVSLADTLLAGQAPEPRAIFAEVSFDPPAGALGHTSEKVSTKTAVLLGKRKLVHDLRADSWELYHRERDPRELRDIYGKNAETSAALRARLEAWERTRAEDRAAEETQASEEDLERLRGLGYVD